MQGMARLRRDSVITESYCSTLYAEVDRNSSGCNLNSAVCKCFLLRVDFGNACVSCILWCGFGWTQLPIPLCLQPSLRSPVAGKAVV
mmetsp:Transcript_64076/g.119104  ORF Transcript_64076/g.119104 Transcript_64076/m.119104 type:complete len:87 (-) Transcript_64076:22-282(-)